MAIKSRMKLANKYVNAKDIMQKRKRASDT